MNTMKSLRLIAAIILLCFPACNYTPEGECWYKDQGSDNAGAGVGSGGVILPPSPPGGDRGFGAEPPRGPLEANDAPPPKCNKDEESPTESPTKSVCAAGGDMAAGAETLSVCSSECGGECAIDGVNGGPYVKAMFKFVTTLADDGTDTGGGWQEASASLEIVPPLHLPCGVLELPRDHRHAPTNHSGRGDLGRQGGADKRSDHEPSCAEREKNFA